jgi:hypothetical protein
VTLDLEFQNYVEHPPVPPGQMFAQSTAKDRVTLDSWKDTWVKQIRENKKTFGSFADMSIGRSHGQYKHKVCIVAGSGPSLTYNGHLLKERDGIPLISCLHNFHYMEDNDIAPEYYVTLDAGEVTIDEVSEGGTREPDEYWERTKDRKLLAFVGSHPKLLEKWQGEIEFFNCPLPDQKINDEIEAIEPFFTNIATGGNVLGACFYLAKGIFGANPIAFVGADFAFSYDKKFHGWDSKYDQKLGHVDHVIDIYGNKTCTWPSYFGFKNWFDFISLVVPGLYINCSEGGCMGAQGTGNLMSIKQMELKKFLEMYTMYQKVEKQCKEPATAERFVLF